MIITEANINTIRELTAANQHSEAVEYAARITGVVPLITEASLVTQQHYIVGSLSPALRERREEVFSAVMALLKLFSPPEVYAELHRAF